jgi:sugar phosphate isomerase/epimerase
VGLADAADRLALSSYTLGVSLSFEERVRVAAEAGFAGIGLRAENYLDARAAGLKDADLRAILDHHGIAVLEVEYLTGWGSVQTRDAAQRDKEQIVFHLARTFGVSQMNTGLLEKVPRGEAIDGFARLCRRAGELTVALEFLPYGGVPDLKTAWQVVAEAGRPNSGLVIDCWHWNRGGVTAGQLAPVPAERILVVQLCDVRAEPMRPAPSREEALHHRLPPGRGYGHVDEILQILADKGVDGLVSVEVISDELLAQGPAVTAATVMAASKQVLARLSGR